MCEHKDISKYQQQPRTYLAEELVTNSVVLSPPSIRELKVSYYALLKHRVKTWSLLCTKPNLETFHRVFGDVNEPEREAFWKLIQHVHYHVQTPKVFFESLMELAIEEKARFHSFATADELRDWLAPHLNQHFDDTLLVKLYLYIRDGERLIYMDA